MLRTFAAAAVVSAVASLASTSVIAAPVAPQTGAATSGAAQTNLVPVHGWHRHCEWGPVRYHRHVPGLGNVPCPRVDYRDRHDHRDRRDRYDDRDSCRDVRRQCAYRFEYGSRGYEVCLRHEGC